MENLVMETGCRGSPSMIMCFLVIIIPCIIIITIIVIVVYVRFELLLIAVWSRGMSSRRTLSRDNLSREIGRQGG